MTIPLSRQDIRTLAALHQALLPTSTLTALGQRYLRSFWRYCAGSPLEQVLVERDAGGRIVGAALISFEPERLSWRLAVKTPLLLHIWRILPRLLRGGNGPSASPEMILIFTDPAVQGRGVGHALLKGSENAVRERAGSSLFVRTFGDPQHPSARFYQRAGYTEVARFIAFGSPFLLYRKELDAASGAPPDIGLAQPR